MIQKNFQYKNTTIAYTVIGKGNTIILLHGFGETSATFIHQINFLKKPPHKKFFAYAHCTHLPLLAYAQTHPKSKVKRVQSPTLYKYILDNYYCLSGF